MNADLQAMLGAVLAALGEGVRPHVHDEQARIQLAAAIDILSKLRGMTAWAPDALARQAAVLADGCRAFDAAAHRLGLEPPAAAATAPDLAEAEREIDARTDWLFARQLPPDLHAELDTILRAALRQQLVDERKRIPLTDFASMSAGGGPRGDAPST